MNKIFFHLLLTFVAVVMMLESCSPSVKGENGKSYTSYQEACSDREFGAAHKLIDAMKESDELDSWDYKKAYCYIFDAETLYLIEQGDEGSADRIILLLEEFDRKFDDGDSVTELDRYEKLISTTVTLENINLLKKLVINKHKNWLISCHCNPGLDDVLRCLLEHGEKETAFTSLKKFGKYDGYDAERYNSACNVLLDYSLEQGNLEDAQWVLDMFGIDPSDEEYTKKQYDDAKAKFNRYYKAGKLK